MHLKIRRYIFGFLMLLAIWSGAKAQSRGDSNKIFLNSKGHWNLPLSYFTSVMTESQRSGYRGCWSEPSIEFYTDRPTSPVLAVFGGLVVGVFNIGDVSGIMTQFGDYFITYGYVTKSYVKKGDSIETGQTIASLDSNSNHWGMGLDIIISDKNDKDFDPEKWFDWHGKAYHPVFGNLRDGTYSLEYDEPFTPRKKGILEITDNNYTQILGQNDTLKGKIRWIDRLNFEFINQDTSKRDSTSVVAFFSNSFGKPIIELQKARGDTTNFRTTYPANLELTINSGKLVKLK
jgi:hypothetical protein